MCKAFDLQLVCHMCLLDGLVALLGLHRSCTGAVLGVLELYWLSWAWPYWLHWTELHWVVVHCHPQPTGALRSALRAPLIDHMCLDYNETIWHWLCLTAIPNEFNCKVACICLYLGLPISLPVFACTFDQHPDASV